MKVPYRAVVISGSMASGKTTWVLNKIGEAAQYLMDNGVDDDQILVLHVTEMPLSTVLNILADLGKDIDLSRIRHFYFFNDDAPAAEGQFSRAHQRHSNVKTSRQYIMIRHRLSKDHNFTGSLVVFHATQVYHLLDITFRRTARLHLFKDYPTEPMDRKIIGMMLGRAYMHQLLKITLKITVPRSKDELIKGLSSAVAILSGRIKFVVMADKSNRPKNYYFYPGSEYNIDGVTRYNVTSMTFRKFADIIRRNGIKAGQANLLRAYRELMFELGIDITRGEYD